MNVLDFIRPHTSRLARLRELHSEHRGLLDRAAFYGGLDVAAESRLRQVTHGIAELARDHADALGAQIVLPLDATHALCAARRIEQPNKTRQENKHASQQIFE